MPILALRYPSRDLPLVNAAAVENRDGVGVTTNSGSQVLTATKVFPTLVDFEPFMISVTSEVVWTDTAFDISFYLTSDVETFWFAGHVHMPISFFADEHLNLIPAKTLVYEA
ncbi:hypothetical protein K435DRAFT_851655 [Dendrothele bispora CBS 962.96]|uniref:Uncharacterized protein n=1 Tax=Dendrothele bispora (strain CBS 962.96) TaxID=1314807 RepID=A0A4S8MMD7_DENBC|nr:hypothetical protein K435DRAFT_851655 [Dendrothele bispora CBS 962.96]